MRTAAARGLFAVRGWSGEEILEMREREWRSAQWRL